MRKPSTRVRELIIALFFMSGMRLSVCAQNTSIDVPDVASYNDSPASRFWFSSTTAPSLYLWETPLPEAVSGTILDINDQEIVYLAKGNPTPVHRPSKRLQAIDFLFSSETAIKAHAAFEQRQFNSAIELAKTAIAEGKIPRWQQRILAAEITDCLMNLGHTANACRVFISLCKESPFPILYASTPLNWTTERADTGLTQQSQAWITLEKEPIAQLLGASWLLTGSDTQSIRAILEKLSRSKDTTVSQLASAQLWRLAPPTQVVEQYHSWLLYRDQMLLPLQVGPTIAIAHKLEKAGKLEESVSQWLRIAALFPTNEKAAKLSSDSAMELLGRLGRNEEAAKLLQSIKP